MTSQAAAGQYGSVGIPALAPDAGEAVTDRALSLLGAYLKAFVNAYGTAAYQAVDPSRIPIANVLVHDPRKRVFSDRDLPALYLFRDGGEPEQVAEDIRVTHARVSGLWVFPLASQDQQRQRDPFVSGLTKLIDDAFKRERDPSFVITGDTDPKAADYGSDWQSAAHVDHVWLAKWDRAQVDIRMADGGPARSYDAASLAITLNEYDSQDFTDATEPSAVSITTTTPDGAVTTAAYSDAIAP